MTEIRFYHLQRTPLESALPKILERVIERGQRAIVMAGSEERVEDLTMMLWTYKREGFLPHGSAADGNAADQPVWLTPHDENPNDATILVLTDGVESDRVDRFEMCLEMFDGRDDEAVAAARERWRRYRDAGHSLTYWQQGANGSWEEKASAG